MESQGKNTNPAKILDKVAEWEESNQEKENKALCHILKTLLNTVETSKNANFGESVHLLFWPQLKLFINIYDNYKDHVFSKTDYEDIFKFISRTFLAVSTANNSSHQFFKNPSLDPYIFSLPLKVSLFYAAFIDKAKTFLIELEEDGEPKDNAKYEFLLSPEPFELIEVEECFRKASINIPTNERVMDKLLFIRAAEHELFNATFIFPLMHEIIHFVGAFTRKRDVRYKVLKEFVSKQFVECIWYTIPKCFEIPANARKCAKKAMVDIIMEKIKSYDEVVETSKYGEYGSDLKSNFTKHVCAVILDDYDTLVKPLVQAIWTWLKDCSEKKLYSLYQDSNVYKTTPVKDTLFRVEAANAILISLWDNLYKIRAKLTGVLHIHGIKAKLSNESESVYLNSSSVPTIKNIVDDFIYLSAEIYADLIAICSLRVNFNFYLKELSKQGSLLEALTFARVHTVLYTLHNKNDLNGFEYDDISSFTAVQDTIVKTLDISNSKRTPTHRDLHNVRGDTWYLNAEPLRIALLEYAGECYDANRDCIRARGESAKHEVMTNLFYSAKTASNIVDVIIEHEHLIRDYMKEHDW